MPDPQGREKLPKSLVWQVVKLSEARGFRKLVGCSTWLERELGSSFRTISMVLTAKN
jgi:hypothetical protein